MLNEVSRLQREQVDADDIHAVVAQFLTTYYMGQETNAAQAGDLAQFEIIGGGWRNSVEFIERVKAVTPAEVQEVARKYMKNMRFVVLGDPGRIDRSVFTGQAAAVGMVR
jgi:zinc protease